MKIHAYCNQQLALVLLELGYFKSISIGVGFLAEATFSFLLKLQSLYEVRTASFLVVLWVG